jgi:universal stress protein E
MRRFQNILVGVDLSSGDRLVACELVPPTREAIDRSVWLAKRNSAQLTFFSALDVSAIAQRLIEEAGEGSEPSVLQDAQAALGRLVEEATAEGVTAKFEIRFGKSWLEIIRAVLRNQHDLVVAGTRHLGNLEGLLMGSTGIKLLRKCPCPVWITQPQNSHKIESILVAHCLRPVGDLAMELGSSMAEHHGAQLHVVHALEFDVSDDLLPGDVIPAQEMSRRRILARQHIESQGARYDLTQPPQIEIVTQPADQAVLSTIEKKNIQLLVMGTVARTGIAGMITGNTAERLLPQIACSVVAVKPPGFETPVQLE